jgi:hypothetical protein
MLLIRDIMYCKPGKVRPLVEKFLAMSKLSEKMGMGKMKVMTDLSAERYWTVVAEMETPSLQTFEQMMAGHERRQGDGGDHERLPRPGRLRAAGSLQHRGVTGEPPAARCLHPVDRRCICSIRHGWDA